MQTLAYPYPRFVARLLLLALAGLSLVGGCALSQSPPPAELLAAAAAPVRLERTPVTVALVPAGGDLAARVAALDPGREIYLVLDGLRVIGDPGSLYRVELVAADAARRPAQEVGSFNVFGVAHAQGATAQRSFVVTAALRGLAAGAAAVRLTPDPAAAPGAHVEIARISLVVQ